MAWTTVFNDTFTDTAGTALTDHSPDTGTSWSLDQNPGGAGTIPGVKTGNVAGILGAGAVGNPIAITSISDSLNADQAVEAEFLTTFSNGGMFLAARYTHNGTDDWDAYIVYLDSGSNLTRLARVVGGSITSLATNLPRAATNSVIRIEVVEVAGDPTIKVYDDGVEIAGLAYTDTNAAALHSGGAALVFKKFADQFDVFKAEHEAGGGGGTIVPQFMMMGVG